MSKKSTALLLILDGWGHREATDSNAIANAATPTWDSLWQQQPSTLLDTSGQSVGLPAGQMGNSEVGHMNLGAGRVVYQSLTRIDKDIVDGEFYENEVLVQATKLAASSETALHVLGLMSQGGIHSHEDQIMAALELARQRGVRKLYLHAFLDGRDTPPRSALPSLQRAEAFFQRHGIGRVASMCGRFYAMDRDNRWDRVQSSYRLLTEAKAPFTSTSASAGLEAAYQRDEDDEFVQATVIQSDGEAPALIDDGDVVLFMNFRADRARQLTRTLVDDDFDGFERSVRPLLGDFVMLTEYAADIDTACAYPPQVLDNVLGQYLADNQRTQLRIAETEKYAHVTFFFNGGREAPFTGEDRTLIPSPQVKTYDLQPEMSAVEVTDELVKAIASGDYDTIICNYANGDMVGHTGNFEASIRAVETIDACLSRAVSAIEEAGGHLLITADHGNVEQMLDPETHQPLTSHTSGPVPLVYVGASDLAFTGEGSLCDIAPTLLYLMSMPVPDEMTGKVLLQPSEPAQASA